MSPQILRDEVVGVLIHPGGYSEMRTVETAHTITNAELDAVMGEIVRLQAGYIRQLSDGSQEWTREDK